MSAKDEVMAAVNRKKSMSSSNQKIYNQIASKVSSMRKSRQNSALPITQGSDGTYYHSTSGKSYDSVYDYLKKRSYAKSHAFENFRNNYLEYKKGNISYDELFRYVPAYQNRKHIEEQLEYNEKFAEENKAERPLVDRILGVFQYNGIIEGLYNLTDGDEDTTFLQGLKDGLKYWNPFTDDVSNRHTFSDVLENTSKQTGLFVDENPDKLDPSDVPRAVYGFLGDVVLDPLSWLSGGTITGAKKILQGSGYGLDAVRAVKQGENVRSVSQAADVLHDLEKGGGVVSTANRATETSRTVRKGVPNVTRVIRDVQSLSDKSQNIEKLKRYTNYSTASDFMGDARVYWDNAGSRVSDSMVRQTAQRFSDGYNDTVLHIYFNDATRPMRSGRSLNNMNRGLRESIYNSYSSRKRSHW